MACSFGVTANISDISTNKNLLRYSCFEPLIDSKLIGYYCCAVDIIVRSVGILVYNIDTLG